MSYDAPKPVIAYPSVFSAPTKERAEYPRCPRCGGPVAGALLTSTAIESGGQIYYPAGAVSVHCASADCNYDMPISALQTPTRVPA